MKTYFSLKRLKQHFWFGIANLPMPGHGYRPFFVKMGGVIILEVKKTFITMPVVIGEKAIVGAGSVITKNIPDYEVWAGNPAHFIRKIK